MNNEQDDNTVLDTSIINKQKQPNKNETLNSENENKKINIAKYT